MKTKLLTLLILIYSISSFAQSKREVLTTFASGIVYNNQSGLGNENSIGFATITGIETNINKNLFLFCGVDFQSISVKKYDDKYSLEGSISIIPINIGIVLKASSNKWKPYLKLGTGIAFVSTPFAEVESGTNFIKIKSNTRISAIVQSGIGLEWNYKPTLIPFIEVYNLHTFAKSDVQNKGLWTFPAVIGLKIKM